MNKGTSCGFRNCLTTIAVGLAGIGLISFYAWLIHFTWNLALIAKDPGTGNLWFLVTTLGVLGPISYGLFRILRG